MPLPPAKALKIAEAERRQLTSLAEAAQHAPRHSNANLHLCWMRRSVWQIARLPGRTQRRCRPCCCGGSAGRFQECRVCWRTCREAGARNRSAKRKKIRSYRLRSGRLRRTPPTGVPARWLPLRMSVPPPCIASGKNISCSHTEASRLSSATYRTSRAKSATAWACI